MKSVKKRFRMALEEVAREADDLALLSAQLGMLDPVQRLAVSAKEACYLLSNSARQLDKNSFVEQMRREPALASLDRLVDVDVISEVEQGFSAGLMEGEGGNPIVDFMQQLLEKLERHLLLLNTHIQELGELLNEGD